MSGLVLGRRPLGTILRSLNKLSQWLCHDDSTISIVLDIIIIIAGAEPSQHWERLG